MVTRGQHLWGFPGGACGNEFTSQCRRHRRCRFYPWVGKIPWTKKWQPTPVFLPGEFHGQRSLVDYVCGATKELGTTEQLNTFERRMKQDWAEQQWGRSDKALANIAGISRASVFCQSSSLKVSDPLLCSVIRCGPWRMWPWGRWLSALWGSPGKSCQLEAIRDLLRETWGGCIFMYSTVM